MGEVVQFPMDIDRAMKIQNACQNVWLDDPSPTNARRLAYSWELLIRFSGIKRRSKPYEPNGGAA